MAGIGDTVALLLGSNLVIEIILLAMLAPREISCSTAEPPSAVCCRVLKQMVRDRRLSRDTKEIVRVYLKQKCSGAEFALL